MGITAVGLVACLSVSILGFNHPEMVAQARKLVAQIDFSDVVFHGLLSLLLFAGALHVDLSRMRRQRRAVIMLATVGVVISTAAVGAGFYYAGAMARPPDQPAVVPGIRRPDFSHRPDRRAERAQERGRAGEAWKPRLPASPCSTTALRWWRS
ncbi:cation:proton antiporter domain-containing protein [Cupriavidus basilensis]